MIPIQTINQTGIRTQMVLPTPTNHLEGPPNPLHGGRSPTPMLNWPCATAVIILALICAQLIKSWLKPRSDATKAQPVILDESDWTQSFISSIPSLTRQLNLEVATASQMETIERSDGRRALWGLLDLGTNVAQIRVEVTYRFHIRLADPWKLVATNQTLVPPNLVSISSSPAWSLIKGPGCLQRGPPGFAL